MVQWEGSGEVESVSLDTANPEEFSLSLLSSLRLFLDFCLLLDVET